MNKQPNGRLRATNHSTDAKKVSYLLNEFYRVLKEMKRSAEEFREFNRKAREFLETFNGRK